MSVRVMTDVWAIDLPDSQKIVLLALADCANDEGYCWPSMATLSTKCSKGERTVQGVIKELVKAGHLSRNEKPGRGCEYTVHPRRAYEMQGYTPPEFHYLYRTENPETGEYYIGARTCVVDPEKDTYWGSGKWVKAERSLATGLVKTILAEYPTREALALAEHAATLAAFGDALCRNEKIATPGTLSPTKQPPQALRPADIAPRKDRATPPQPVRPTPAAAADKPSKNHQEPSDQCASGDALKPEHIVEVWNETAQRLGKPQVRNLTPERRQLLKARIGQYALDDFRAVFGKIERSAFLRGDTGWRGCTFDWVFKKANFQKILEGNYDG